MSSSSSHKKDHGEENNNDDSIWIFAYGSLCWRPGFSYDEVRTGHVNGFMRRFWQGNVTHRGSPSKPGRVATLVPCEDAQTYGCAYRIKRNQLSILEYLENREMKLGGYVCVWTVFFPYEKSDGKHSKDGVEEEEEEEDEDDDDDDDEEDEEIVEDDDDVGFPCLCYIALEGNSLWLGEDSEMSIATQISEAKGICGENQDYLLSLYKYMKTNFPLHYDEHLEEIMKHL
ncbi:unnamed protein product [Allacma fusca]|uniref:Gamma-glutamylcyclotransferase n=1 Tax=Allacma fusca TaxID=39272 RepID=A0A8J2LVH1_9HEXA|nr:unnamed protein product [Allacma fusca]